MIYSLGMILIKLFNTSKINILFKELYATFHLYKPDVVM